MGDDHYKPDSNANRNSTSNFNNKHQVYRRMNYQNAQGIVTTTLQNHRGLVSAVLRGVLNAVYRFIRFISYPVIRLLRLCLGILLMCNPLAMLGFGATGPIAGTLAAFWQSTMGGIVTAGGPFSILQSVGMTWGPVAIPVAGAVVAGAAVTPPDVKERARKWWEELVDKVRGRDEKEEMEETEHDHKAQVVESN